MSILAVYTTAFTFVSGTNAIVMAVAIPGGLLMIAWHAMVGVRLLGLSTSAQQPIALAQVRE